MQGKLKKKFIGDRAFYKMVLTVAVPIMVQNGITNFVGLLDNIMVGQVGTEQMSGVAIVNQLLMVYYLCVFGGLAGDFYGAVLWTEV
jgi:Na+-driven multidrug efflux pump